MFILLRISKSKDFGLTQMNIVWKNTLAIYMNERNFKQNIKKFCKISKLLCQLIPSLQLVNNFYFQSTNNQNEYLCPILTVLNKSARSCRAHRKYLRQEVLPPLRDVSRPPEKGSTLRNQLCRLLTTPITAIRDLVAEFLFILCKEKGQII